MRFKKGDVVQVDYKSIQRLSQWLDGTVKVGPGDIGIVRFSPGWESASGHLLTVDFPFLGIHGIHSSDLKLVDRAESENS